MQTWTIYSRTWTWIFTNVNVNIHEFPEISGNLVNDFRKFPGFSGKFRKSKIFRKFPDFSGNFRIFRETFPEISGFFRKFPEIVSLYVWMSWFIHDWFVNFMNDSWMNHEFFKSFFDLKNSWMVYEWFMIDSWLVHDSFMTFWDQKMISKIHDSFINHS